MKECKIAVFNNSGEEIEVKNTEVPSLKKGEILVKNECTTICRSDINTFVGKRIEKTPTILGHEIVGKIEKFGEGAGKKDERQGALKEGDRVTWAIYASDPESEMSKKGIPQKGDNLFKYGHERITKNSNLHGGLSEYTILQPFTPIVKINEEVPTKIVAIINCAVATAAGAIRLAGEINGKTVAISGIGMLGSIACSMCKTMGANKIMVTDLDDGRLDTAQKFGADHAVHAEESIEDDVIKYFGETQPFDVAIEFSGAASAMENSLKHVAIGGTIVWVGATFPQRDLKIDAEKIIRNIHTIKGLHNYTNKDLVTAVEFIENNYHSFPFGEMIHDQFTLDQVNEAFEYAIKQNPFRVGIKY